MEKKENYNMKIKINPKIKELIGPEAFLAWLSNRDNALSLYNMGDVAGRWIEKIIEQNEGDGVNESTNQNTHGHDVKRNGKKGEIKTTSTKVTTLSTQKHRTCYMKIGGLEDKRGKTDEFIIFDKVNFHRFCIPHDVFFNEGDFYGEGRTLSFRWYADYDEDKTFQKTKRNLLDDGTYKLRSKKMSNNTKLLKKYQILN